MGKLWTWGWLVRTCGLAGVVKWTNRGYDQDAVSSISLRMSPCYESSFFTNGDLHEPLDLDLGPSLPFQKDLRLGNEIWIGLR